MILGSGAVGTPAAYHLAGDGHEATVIAHRAGACSLSVNQRRGISQDIGPRLLAFTDSVQGGVP